MAFLEKLKSRLSGLKKGGEIMDDPYVFNSAVSPIMREKTREWWDIFRGVPRDGVARKGYKPLPTAYISTAYLARLVTGEIKFELPDERLDAFVQKNLMPRIDRIVQLALVGGYAVVKPYIAGGGEVFFDVGTSRDFVPINLNENGDITEGIFFERICWNGKIYERREWHRFSNGVHSVRNSAYLYGTRERVALSSIPRWEHLCESGEIPSDFPMFATLRNPGANNIDLDSRLPVSIFANSAGTLYEIDEAHSEYVAEFKKMRAKVFADETVFHGKDGITDDYFVTVGSDFDVPVNHQIMAFAPSIREAAHKAAINTELRLYEMQIGVSCGTFSFDNARGRVTATQVLSEDRTTNNTVAQLQRRLRPVLRSIANITAVLARFYGFDVVAGEPAIEFGDSVFEDTGKEFDRRLQMVREGLLKPEDFDAWYFGVTADKARGMLPDIG